jgi:hypothetical protein
MPAVPGVSTAAVTVPPTLSPSKVMSWLRTWAFQHVHDLREVNQRAAEAIHFVDHDAVDLAVLDVAQQPLEGGALHIPAGEPAVVVAVGQADPALGLLAGDVRLARIALGVEAVELLL